jgi:K+-sensing histidine kinase KdpD
MMSDDLQPIEGLSLRTLLKRGRMKIFLGYAPGVGKTFTMLAEAHRRISRGEDVVIGFLETHGRAETAKMAEGLEQVHSSALSTVASTSRSSTRPQ